MDGGFRPEARGSARTRSCNSCPCWTTAMGRAGRDRLLAGIDLPPPDAGMWPEAACRAAHLAVWHGCGDQAGAILQRPGRAPPTTSSPTASRPGQDADPRASCPPRRAAPDRRHRPPRLDLRRLRSLPGHQPRPPHGRDRRQPAGLSGPSLRMARRRLRAPLPFPRLARSAGGNRRSRSRQPLPDRPALGTLIAPVAGRSSLASSGSQSTPNPTIRDKTALA
jgi:hypothetical protein